MSLRTLIALSCLFFSSFSYSQIRVPAQAITVLFPSKSVSFEIQNIGDSASIVQVDLAKRSDVHESSNDGLAIIYPRVSRIPAGESQTIRVTWRGNMDKSYYYFVRINTIDEIELKKDRSNVSATPEMKVKVGQAFPIHLEAPDTRPGIVISQHNGNTMLLNKGLRGDHIEALRIGSSKILPFRQFITPGQTISAPEEINQQHITAVKLRRFGWVTLSGKQ